MLELNNNKHNTYYRCTYLYIVNAVIFKMLFTSKMWFNLKNNNNVTTLICLAISVRAKVLRDPLVQYSRGLNWYSNIDKLAALVRGVAGLKHCLAVRQSQHTGTANQSQHTGTANQSQHTGTANQSQHTGTANHNTSQHNTPRTNWVVCARLGRKVL